MPYAAVASNRSTMPVSLAMTERDRTIGDMRSFLSRTRPQTPAEALRLLRNAYPDAPLSLRVAACGLA